MSKSYFQPGDLIEQKGKTTVYCIDVDTKNLVAAEHGKIAIYLSESEEPLPPGAGSRPAILMVSGRLVKSRLGCWRKLNEE